MAFGSFRSYDVAISLFTPDDFKYLIHIIAPFLYKDLTGTLILRTKIKGSGNAEIFGIFMRLFGK